MSYSRTTTTGLLLLALTISHRANGFSPSTTVSKFDNQSFQRTLHSKSNGWTFSPLSPARIQDNRSRTPTSTALQNVIISSDVIALAKTVAPQVGVITSTALYLAPALSVWKAIQDNDVGDLNPLPVSIMSIVSISWLAYGLSARDKYVAISNIGGAIVSVAYVVGMLPLLSNNKKALRQTQTVVMAGVTAVLSLWTYLGVSRTPIGRMSTTLGMFASALFLILSASPLSTIRTVIATKNSISILGSLTAAQVTNTLLWSIYGLAVSDLFVWGPNAIGLGLGLIQLVLKIIFPSKQTRGGTIL